MRLETKNFKHPDEVRDLPKSKIEVVNFEDSTLMRSTFQPGWKWSECIRPTAGTETCDKAHINYIISGQLMIVMDDGTKKELNPGDAVVIPPGHDAYVVGNEPCVTIDFISGKTYGLRSEKH